MCYADSIKNALVRYQLKENKKSTLFEDIEQYIEYDGNVVCDIIQIYEDGNIYLSGCIINNDNSRGYVYGEQHLDNNNVRAVIESKTGIVPTQDEDENIVPGSEFKIKVSNDIKDENGNIVEYTFFVLSNSEDGKYVNLIAEQNITPDGTFTSEPQDGDEWYKDKTDNRYGPQMAYLYLSKATSNWTNIPITKNFTYKDEGNKEYNKYGYQNIKTILNELTGEYETTITPYSSDYGNPVIYENMRTRFPYISEIMENTSCKNGESASISLYSGACPLWMVNYLSSDKFSEPYYNDTNGKVNSKGNNNAYWTLSSSKGNETYARSVYFSGFVTGYSTANVTVGIRPVITVLKSDLLRVMK